MIFACKRKNVNTFNQNELKGGPPPSSYTNVTNPNDIDEQFKWIAKGYVNYFKNATQRSWMNTYLFTKNENVDVHTYLNTFFINNHNVDVDDIVYAGVNSYFPTNNYNRGFFYGYNFDFCLNKTGIKIVDSTTINLPWVVTYEPNNQNDTVWGYFATTTNTIDSVELHNDNYDDYCVYAIISEDDCFKALKRRGLRGCLQNGTCEPQHGESIESGCIDCINKPQQPNEKKLSIDKITILEDKRRFDEHWTEGKYHLFFDFIILDPINSILLNKGCDYNKYLQYNEWKRSEVKRCKKSGNCKGAITSKTSVIKDIYNNFLPNIDDLYFYFFEYDQKADKKEFKSKIKNGQFITFNNIFNDFWQRKAKSGTFYNEQVGGSQGPGVLVIPTGSLWVTDPNNAKRHTIKAQNPSGEIEIELSYLDF